MRIQSLLAGNTILSLLLAAPASSQTSQISKRWEIGHHSLADQLESLAQHVERKDGRFDYDGVDYVQRIEDRVATTAGVKPYEIRVTRSNEWYGFLLPQRVLYISGGLLGRVSSEAELAGLLAHELAHEMNPKAPAARFQQCALAAGYLPVQHSPRESERLATQRAIGYMKASGYDPSALLDLFSKVSYEYRRWSKAIGAEDLLRLRVTLEAEAEPVGGYAIDDAAFVKFHARLPGAVVYGTPTIRIAH